MNALCSADGKVIATILQAWPLRCLTLARGFRRLLAASAVGTYLRALAQRVEVDAQELRIMGSKSELLRTLVAASGAKSAGFGVPSFVPKWRARSDSNYSSNIFICRLFFAAIRSEGQIEGQAGGALDLLGAGRGIQG